MADLVNPATYTLPGTLPVPGSHPERRRLLGQHWRAKLGELLIHQYLERLRFEVPTLR